MTVQWALLRKTIRAIAKRSCGTRDRSACPFSLYRILFGEMAEYILPGEDDHFLAMHSMASLGGCPGNGLGSERIEF